MIQRTRAPLSSLEPLSQPHFAPTRPSPRLWAGVAGEIAETAADGSGVRGPVRHADGRGPGAVLARSSRADTPADGPAVSATAPRPGEDEPPGRAPGRHCRWSRALPPPATPQCRSGPARPAASRPPAPGHRPATGTAGHRAPPAEASQAPAASRRAACPARESGRVPPTQPAPRADGGASRDVLGPGTEPPALPAVAEPGAAPAVKPATVPATASACCAARSWRVRTGKWPVPPESAADTSGRPDVTISIGHIEVRAAPPIERPAARPPFRPRVSLDDFLNQPQDRRR